MTQKKHTAADRAPLDLVQAALSEDIDGLKPLIQEVLQQVLEAEREECLGARKGERTESHPLPFRLLPAGLGEAGGPDRVACAAGPAGRFRTELLEHYQRSEKALVAALAEMYVQGVSTRKVKAITEELCGHAFSSSTISRATQALDDELPQFATRKLDDAYPYLVLDARYEKVREEGVIRSRAVLVAIGINEEGRRCVLGVDLASRGSATSWKEFLEGLVGRGLRGVEFVASDDHSGLRKAIPSVLPAAAWQRCYVHFMRNGLDYLPRKADDDCLMELCWLYDRHGIEEARRDVAKWLEKWSGRYAKLCQWVEDNIEETFSFYRLPREHHKHMKEQLRRVEPPASGCPGRSTLRPIYQEGGDSDLRTCAEPDKHNWSKKQLVN